MNIDRRLKKEKKTIVFLFTSEKINSYRRKYNVHVNWLFLIRVRWRCRPWKKNTKYGQNSPRSWDPISLTLHYLEFRKRVGISNAISVAIVTNPSFIFLLSGPMVATLPAVRCKVYNTPPLQQYNFQKDQIKFYIIKLSFIYFLLFFSSFFNNWIHHKIATIW